MPRKIATAAINKSDAMEAFFGYERLRRTSKNPNGPLARMIEWFKKENGRTFDLSHMHLGKPEEDYVLIYYFEGVRYRIGKDGNAQISTADADVFLDDVEKDFQNMVDTILHDEISMYMRKIAEVHGAKIGKAKYADASPNVRTKGMFGITVQ